MALRRDYSLTKDIDFKEQADVYDLSADYQSVYMPAENFNKLIPFTISIYRGCCGEGEDINRIYEMFEEYSKIDVTDPNYSFAEGASHLKDMYMVVTDYEKELEDLNYELGNVIDGWLAKINPDNMTPEQKMQDKQYVGQVEMILNRRVFIHETKEFMDDTMRGYMTEEECPKEDADPNSLFTALKLPLMTHLPRVADIDVNELDNPLMQILYNLVEKDYYLMAQMLHDYDNGHVCVRLWKKEDGKFVPVFTSINKTDIYLDKIVNSNQKTIWPGIIEEAVNRLGCENDKQSLAEALLGEKVLDYDMDFLLGPNNPPVSHVPESFNVLVNDYIKCFYDTYAAMLGTNSLIIEDEAPYVKMLFGIKELNYALSCCFGSSLDVAMDAVNMLKQLMADYRESVSQAGRTSESTVKKRLSICDTIDDVMNLLLGDSQYHIKPRAYFERFLAEQIAVILLQQLHKELTDENKKAMAISVMNDRSFVRKAEKINIHLLKHSTSKLAESVLAKMEGRKPGH